MPSRDNAACLKEEACLGSKPIAFAWRVVSRLFEVTPLSNLSLHEASFLQLGVGIETLEGRTFLDSIGITSQDDTIGV